MVAVWHSIPWWAALLLLRAGTSAAPVDQITPEDTSSGSQMKIDQSHGSNKYLRPQSPASTIEIKHYIYNRTPSRTIVQAPIVATNAILQTFKGSSIAEPLSLAVPLTEKQFRKDGYLIKQSDVVKEQRSADTEKLKNHSEIKSEIKQINVLNQKVVKLTSNEFMSSEGSSDILKNGKKMYVFTKRPYTPAIPNPKYSRDDPNSNTKIIKSIKINKNTVPILIRYLPEIGKFIAYKPLTNNPKIVRKVFRNQVVNLQSHKQTDFNQREFNIGNHKVKRLGFTTLGNKNRFVEDRGNRKSYIAVRGKVVNNGHGNVVILYRTPSAGSAGNSYMVPKYQVIPSHAPYSGRGFAPTPSGDKPNQRIRIQVNRNGETSNYVYDQLTGKQFQNGGSGAVMGQSAGSVNLQNNIQGYPGTANPQRDLNIVRERLNTLSNKFPALNLPVLLRL